MDLIDDEGDLFGAVNVVDAFVVLFVLAVLVAGAALVLQPEPEGPTAATTNVTLDFGTQPTYIAAAITEGDTHSAGANSRLTLTDVLLTPQDGDTHVVVRARVRGVASDGSLAYANAPLRLGRNLDIATDRYRVSGRIRDVGRTDTLARETTRVVLRDTVAAVGAREITPGDEIRLADRTVATIEDVAAYPTNDPTQRTVFVEATLETYRSQGERRFGDTPVRRGQTITLPDESYTLDGRIDRVGGGLDRATANVVVESVVGAETAGSIAEGDVATVAGHETAEIASVTTYATRNPNRTRVIVGVALRTLTYGEQPRFGTAPIQRGASLTIDTDQYTLSGRIARTGALEPQGLVATRSVTLRMTDVRQDAADAIQPGLAERSGGEPIAEITAVDVEPSRIIAIGDDGTVTVVDHPFLREVTITADLRVRETTIGPRFKRQSLRQGSRIVIDTGTIIIEAEVVSVGR